MSKRLSILMALASIATFLLLSGCVSGDHDDAKVAVHSEELEAARGVEAGEHLAQAMDYDVRVMERPVTYARSMNEVLERSFAHYHRLDSCDLAEHFDIGGGSYRVEAIVGVTEQARGEDVDRVMAFTFIRLSLVKSWTDGAPKSVIARVPGGPLYEESEVGSFIELRVGESIGALFSGIRQEQNDGFVDIDKLGLFRDYDGTGITNHQLFLNEGLDLDEVGSIIARTYAMDECVPLANPPL